VNSRFVILDPNGEYRECFADLQQFTDVRVFSVEPRDDEIRLTVPAWLWNGEEWAGFLNASPGTQRPVLMQAIRELRAAGMAAGLGQNPAAGQAGRILLATQLRAFVDWLQGTRAEGVAALNFPRVKAMHEQLEGVEVQLRQLADGLGEDEAELAAAADAAAQSARGTRERRTDHRNGQDYIRGFVDADLVEVIDALEAVRRHLPDIGVVAGPSEDMPTPLDPFALPAMIDLIAGLTPGNMQQHMAGLVLRLRTMLSDTRVTPLIAPEDGGEPFTDWLHALLGRGEGGKGQITVLDLSLVPSDVLTTAVSVLGRVVFEAAQRYRRVHGATMPTVIVLEEAHNFIERHTGGDNEPDHSARCRTVFEKIAKEGRKFGVGLMLSSQRPAELSPTIVAQCNSFILHRIVNDRDQELVTRLAPDTTGALLKELPSLPTQQAILLGIASEIPLVFDVRPLPESERPSSAHPDLWKVWTGERRLDHALDEIVEDWTRR
jgi:hypothetical protein